MVSTEQSPVLGVCTRGCPENYGGFIPMGVDNSLAKELCRRCLWQVKGCDVAQTLVRMTERKKHPSLFTLCYRCYYVTRCFLLLFSCNRQLIFVWSLCACVAYMVCVCCLHHQEVVW